MRRSEQTLRASSSFSLNEVFAGGTRIYRNTRLGMIAHPGMFDTGSEEIRAQVHAHGAKYLGPVLFCR